MGRGATGGCCAATLNGTTIKLAINQRREAICIRTAPRNGYKATSKRRSLTQGGGRNRRQVIRRRMTGEHTKKEAVPESQRRRATHGRNVHERRTSEDNCRGKRKVRYSTGEKYCVEPIFFLHDMSNPVFCECELAPWRRQALTRRTIPR